MVRSSEAVSYTHLDVYKRQISHFPSTRQLPQSLLQGLNFKNVLQNAVMPEYRSCLLYTSAFGIPLCFPDEGTFIISIKMFLCAGVRALCARKITSSVSLSLYPCKYLAVYVCELKQRKVIGIIAINPVSYTHLDVYKRQVP